VLVAGVDLAASQAGTAVALLQDVTVVDLLVGADDDAIVSHARGVDKIGVDCPLGWPRAFTAFLAAVQRGADVPAAATVADRSRLALRETDLWVVDHCPPLRPLSVSADRIAHVAFRCAALLPRLQRPVDRTGRSRVVEVYPSGSLHAWGLPFRGYKGAQGTEVRAAIVSSLEEVVHLGRHREACLASDHALDAVLSALSARAAALGRATLPTADQRAAAAAEGWIAIPQGGLAALGRPSSAARR
jgi:predicted nuclease with RNAse H fold